MKDHQIEVLSTFVSIVFLAAQAGGGGFESYPHCRMIWGGIRKACVRWTYKKWCVFIPISLFQAFPIVWSKVLVWFSKHLKESLYCFKIPETWSLAILAFDIGETMARKDLALIHRFIMKLGVSICAEASTTSMWFAMHGEPWAVLWHAWWMRR